MSDKKNQNEKINSEIDTEQDQSEQEFKDKNSMSTYSQQDVNNNMNFYSYNQNNYGYSPKIPYYRTYPQEAYEDPYHRYHQTNDIKMYDDYQTLRMNMRMHKDAKRKPKMRVCSNCVTTTTPSWRRSTDGKKLLCNACGLYQKLHGRPRPFSTTPEGKTKALKSGFDKIKCCNCGTRDTSFWRKGVNGYTLCNSCGLYAQPGPSSPINDQSDEKFSYRYSNNNNREMSVYEEAKAGIYKSRGNDQIMGRYDQNMGYDSMKSDDSLYTNHMYADSRYSNVEQRKNNSYHQYSDGFSDSSQNNRMFNDYNHIYHQQNSRMPSYQDYEFKQPYQNQPPAYEYMQNPEQEKKNMFNYSGEDPYQQKNYLYESSYNNKQEQIEQNYDYDQEQNDKDNDDVDQKVFDNSELNEE